MSSVGILWKIIKNLKVRIYKEGNGHMNWQPYYKAGKTKCLVIQKSFSEQ